MRCFSAYTPVKLFVRSVRVVSVFTGFGTKRIARRLTADRTTDGLIAKAKRNAINPVRKNCSTFDLPRQTVRAEYARCSRGRYEMLFTERPSHGNNRGRTRKGGFNSWMLIRGGGGRRRRRQDRC